MNTNPIVKLAASALPGEKKYVLFAGAGVSKDSGIPTAWDLMLKTASLLYVAENDSIDPNVNLEDWFIKSPHSNMEYSELIEKIYSHIPDQQDFLDKYLTEYDIGEAHRYIAELARRNVIRAIITTNFDHYIEKALEEKGLKIQVISTDDDLKNSEPLIHCKAIRVYKPHGTLGKGALKNTPKDLEKLSLIMEKELIRVLSEHGVIVLGYSGRDKGIQTVFNERNYTYYPLFWVDPQSPEGEIKDILDAKDWTYIQCSSASQFIKDYLNLLSRLDSLAPEVGSGLTISDLKRVLESQKEPAAPLYLEYLNDIFSRLNKIRPEFSKFEHRDDAIIKQIEDGLSTSYDFIETALLASKYHNTEVIKTIYEQFGLFLKLYDIPDGFSESYYETDFDGYKFLVYEMFVSFIAALIKYGRWDSIGYILSEDLFVESRRGSYYVKIATISEYVRSLDEFRNKRLKLRRVSVMADYIKDRFDNSDLSKLLSHKNFLEADYFLFMRTVCNESSEYSTWIPRSCVYMENTPSFFEKAESSSFLEKLLIAMGFENNKDGFVKMTSEKHGKYSDFFGRFPSHDPLGSYNFSKIGQRR
ncbi:SIR2 family protein [Methanosarcina sp.]|nr:SIR2 family protein [Methanosarcina sp.]MDW5554792.1 SIR2 family protein [Methanosarcina sp.]MDW5557922.1 SIR2 family protein [Methanosarcina sp.]